MPSAGRPGAAPARGTLDAAVPEDPVHLEEFRALIQDSRVSAALLAAALLSGAAAFGLSVNPGLLPWPALGAWAAGIGLLLAAAWQMNVAGPPGAAGDGGQAVPWARWEPPALLALTLLALLLRAVLLAEIPRDFGGDEGEMGLMAREVLSGKLVDPFATGWLSHPTLWFFLQALSLRIVGGDVLGLRMLSALVGAAAVPALYLFARPPYGRAVALTATSLLTVYHFHIHFSRLAVNNIVDPLAALVAFAAFLHGYRTRSPFSFALAGVTLGVAQHFYMGSRLAPLVIVAVLLHQVLLDRRRLVSLRGPLVLLALGFGLGFGPLMRFFLQHPEDFFARLHMVGIFETGWFAKRQAQGASTLHILLEQARAAFGAFTSEPDRGVWYSPDMPLLDRFSSVLFLLGVGVTLTRWRRPDAMLLLAWLFGVVIFGGIMLVNSPESPRYVTSAPLLCLLIALALGQLRRAAGWWPPAQRYAQGLSAAIVLVLALWNIHFYFREYTPRGTYGWANTEVATAIGRHLRPQAGQTFVYFFAAPRIYFNNGTIRFIGSSVAGTDVLKPIDSIDDLPPTPPGLRPLFVLLPERAHELQLIRERYPIGTLERWPAETGNAPLFFSYALPP